MSIIIAEIGVNFRDIEHFKEMILKCIDSKVTYIKGQIFTEQHIIDRPDYEILKDKIIDADTAKELMAYANRRGANLFWTPEDSSVTDMVIDLEPEMFKVGHPNYMNKQMAGMLRRTEKEVLVSVPVGHLYSHIPERDALYQECKAIWNWEHVRFLSCVPLYPPLLRDIRLFDFDKEKFSGVSLHYDSIYPHLYAALPRYGARYIEVHVKDDDNCIDAKVSITFEQLKELKQELINLQAMEGWQGGRLPTMGPGGM